MVNKVSIVQTEAVKQYTLGARLDTKKLSFFRISKTGKNYFLNRLVKKFLEYGFGSGVNTIHLLKCGYLITAIDVVKYNKFKLMNKLNNSQKKLKLDILNLKSNRLPYKNNSFDHIVAMSVISLLGNENSVKRLLSEFVRVLKPNGKLIIDINDHESEFSKNSQQNKKKYFFNKIS